MHFTWDEHVLPALKRAVELKGEDYIYERQNSNGFCANWTLDEGEMVPSCVVGHVLHDLLPAESWENVGQCAASTEVIMMLYPEYTFDDKSRAALKRAQELQDTSYTWGAALTAAIIHAERF